MIEIENLRKHYGQVEAVAGISFTVHRGEIVGFLGPNGAGKSTTMKIMTGLTPPSEGNVRISGHDVLEESLEARRTIGFLPEQPPLYPEMIVRDFLDFAARIRGVPSRDRRKAVEEVVDRCGLGEVRDRLIANLSKGYRQRTGLAQAVIHRPKILILDEPTVGLDPNQVIEIRSIISEIGRERTVILSSHILPEVQATCERVVIISRGRLVAQGRMDEILSTDLQSRVVVRLRRPPNEASDLEELPYVESATRIEHELFSLTLGGGREGREEMIRELAMTRYGLFEVRSETATLEEVFRDVVLEEKGT
jgi:ABC-2 type transport system ATP-binding protein